MPTSVKYAMRILLTDVKDVWQEGKRTAFFVRGRAVPIELILDYKENALYLPMTLPEESWMDDRDLNLVVRQLEAPVVRLPLDSVVEYGPVKILRS